MVDEDVPCSDGCEDIGRFIVVRGYQACRDDRAPALQLEVRPVEARQFGQGGQVEHPGDLVAVVLGQADPAQEELARRRRHGPLDLEAYRVAKSPPPELFLDCQQEVVGLVFLDRQVGIACDAEEVALADHHAPEEKIQVGGNDLIEQHEFARLDFEEPREQLRHLYPGEPALTRLRVQQADGKRQRHRADVRERVSRSNCKWRQNREDLLHKPLAQPGVMLGNRRVLQDRDVARGERGAQLRPGHRVFCDELEDAFARGLELLSRRQPVGRGLARPEAVLLAQPGHSNLEELVEVRREDRKESRALECRVALVTRFIEDARVELQPAELAVDVREGRRVAVAAGRASARGRRSGGAGLAVDADHVGDGLLTGACLAPPLGRRRIVARECYGTVSPPGLTRRR